MRLALAIVLVAVALPAQGLPWNGWQPWGTQYITQFSASPSLIYFVPYHPSGYGLCGIEQTVEIPADGTYQLRFHGLGGITGWYSAQWQIQGQVLSWQSHYQQRTWTLRLKAGPCHVRLQSGTSNLPGDYWWMDPPELWPALEPTVDVELYQYQPVNAQLTTTAEYLLLGFGPRPTLQIPGFQHGLEIYASQVHYGTPTASIWFGVWPRVQWPEFYVQALTFSPTPTFGSALRVDPWWF